MNTFAEVAITTTPSSPKSQRHGAPPGQGMGLRGNGAVLIVEDEAIVARDLQRTLEDMGYRVTGCVGTGQEALQSAAQQAPDIVLLDISLRGGMDGIETARILRARYSLPVVYVTAFGDDATLMRAKQTTPYGYLLKPFVAADVRCAIEVALHKHASDEQLSRAARLTALGALAAGVAHEVNNPLTYVLFGVERVADALEAWRRDGDVRATAERVEEIGRLQALVADATEGIERIRRIVADLSAFGRSGADPLGPLDVRSSVAWALRITADMTRFRARVVSDLPEVPLVYGSETRLGQVLVNLITNAVQALPDGDAGDQLIHIRTSLADDGRVMVSVADTGCGIAASNLERIFDPFFTTKDPGAGTGLGLAVSHRIVSDLGGTLRVRSQQGKGSVFEILLPQIPQRTPAEVPGPHSSREPKRARILLVDDEPLLLKTVAATLRREHDVVACAGALEALEVLARDREFDLVLSDMLMPGMSGMQLHAALTSLDAGLAARLAFMTGGADSPTIAKFLAHNPAPFIAKPFGVDELRRWVGDLLEPKPQEIS